MSIALEQSPPVTVGQQTLEYVDNFPYLRSYISRTGEMQRSIREQGWVKAACLPATSPNIERPDNQRDHQVTYVQINCDSHSNLRS